MLLFTSILSFLGGGLVVFFLEWYSRRGKTTINSYNLRINHRILPGFINQIVNLILDIQFINTSGDQTIVKNLSATFYDGTQSHEMNFVNHNVAPAFVVSERKAETFQYELSFLDLNILLPLLAMLNGEVSLTLRYTINEKDFELKILGTEMQVIQV
jgi:hypothetical protein